LTFINLLSGAIPAIPIPLLSLAAIIPATCVPVTVPIVHRWTVRKIDFRYNLACQIVVIPVDTGIQNRDQRFFIIPGKVLQ